MKKLLFGLLALCAFSPLSCLAGPRVKCPVIVDPRDQQIRTGFVCFSSKAAAKKAGYVPAVSGRFFIYYTGFTSSEFTLSGAPRKFLFTAAYMGTYFDAQVLRASDGAEIGRIHDDTTDGLHSAAASIEIPNEAIKVVFDTDGYFYMEMR